MKYNIISLPFCKKGLNSLPNDKNLDWSKLKAFADTKKMNLKNRNSCWNG